MLIIAFFFDRVESLARACKEMSIKFIGLNYINAIKNPNLVDMKLAHFQADYFFCHEEWLDDDKACIFMFTHAEK